MVSFSAFDPAFIPPPQTSTHSGGPTAHTRRHTHTAPQLSPLTALELEQTSPLAVLLLLPHSAKPVEPLSAAFCVGEHLILFVVFLFVFFCTALKSSNIQGGQRSEVYEVELL